MAGSSFGEAFRISTWGESHGAALGVVVDGVPAGLRLDTNRIQEFMDRRKPGQSKFTTARKEADAIEILSGVFEGKTTGTPISMMVRNADQHSKVIPILRRSSDRGMRITLLRKIWNPRLSRRRQIQRQRDDWQGRGRGDRHTDFRGTWR